MSQWRYGEWNSTPYIARHGCLDSYSSCNFFCIIYASKALQLPKASWATRSSQTLPSYQGVCLNRSPEVRSVSCRLGTPLEMGELCPPWSRRPSGEWRHLHWGRPAVWREEWYWGGSGCSWEAWRRSSGWRWPEPKETQDSTDWGKREYSQNTLGDREPKNEKKNGTLYYISNSVH